MDDLMRGMIRSGDLARQVEEGLRGITSRIIICAILLKPRNLAASGKVCARA
jgi:hypothetical protein